MIDNLRDKDIKKIKEEIKEILNNDTWKKELFINKYLSFDDLYETEEQVRQAPLFPYGGFNNLETIEATFKECMLSKIDEIAEWLTGVKKTLRLEFYFDYDIGYIINSSISPIESSKFLVLVLRRDTENLTKNGFFVSAFNVIKK